MRSAYLITIIFLSAFILIPLTALVLVVSLPFDRRGLGTCYMAKAYAWVIVRLTPGWSLKIEGAENIDPKKSYVMIVNHNVLIDIPVVHQLPIIFRWVSKHEILNMPIVGWMLAMQRCITIKRGDTSSAKMMITKGEELLKKGVSVAIFPEGTRSKTGEIGTFHAGAFLMAAKAEVDVLPVMLYGVRNTMKSRLFERVPMKMVVLPAVSLKGRRVSEVSKELNELYREKINGRGNS